MTEQELSDIATLLGYCRREKAWPGPKREIEAIEARYSPAIRKMVERRLTAAGWVRDGSGWTSKAA